MTDWKWEDVEPENEEREDDLTMWKTRVMNEYRIGELREKDFEAGKFPGSVLYVFDGFPDNEKFDKNHVDTWKIWGNKNLNGLMKNINIGDIVKVQFLREHPTDKGNPWQEFKVQKAGGSPSPSSSSSLPGHDKHTVEKAEQGTSDEPEIMDIVHEQEKTVEVARGWLNKITNDMIGEQLTVNEKTLKVEVYRLSQIPAHDKELGYLEEEMAKEVFKLIDKKG